MWLLAVAAAWAGDKDHDGVKGSADQCPDRAEDIDQFEDGDGCPEADNDQDALDDADDKCPDDAEDKDGFEDEDGCPDPDNDHDGVLDAQDQCPLDPEDSNDVDGCPVVTLKLLTETGYMAAIGELVTDLLAGVGQEEKGCDPLTEKVRGWLDQHDPRQLRAEWDARLARAPAELDPNAATDLLAKKGGVYQTLQPALAVYCKDHPGWVALEAPVDEVFAALPKPAPPPPKKKR
jgi:hypothetical protein